MARGAGEIDHHVRLLEQGLRIVPDDDAERLAAGQCAQVASQHMRALALGAADDQHAGGGDQQLQEHLPHAAGAAGDADPNRAATAALQDEGGRRLHTGTGGDFTGPVLGFAGFLFISNALDGVGLAALGLPGLAATTFEAFGAVLRRSDFVAIRPPDTRGGI